MFESSELRFPLTSIGCRKSFEVCQPLVLGSATFFNVTQPPELKKSDRQKVAPFLMIRLKPTSEVNLHSKLELSWIKSGGWTTVISAIVRALLKSLYVIDKWRRSSFIEPVEHIKSLGDQLEAESLTERNHFRQPQIE